MSERIGNCEQCGQRFGGIPDSVTALKVKCTECGGTVVIPPLPEAPLATPAPMSKETAPAAPPKAAPAKEKPLAAPLGDAKPKGNGRPDTAKPVNRDVTTPKKPEAPKVVKPIVPLKPVAKIAKPIKPLKPVVKLAKPVAPVKPVAKPAAPVKPLKPAAPVKPIAKPAQPVKPAAKPVAAKPAVAKPAAPAPKPVVAKPVAAKPAAPTPPPAANKSVPAKPSAADIIAKAKAKRSSEGSAAKEKKPSAADIIAKAKAKREAEPTPAAKPSAKKVAVATGGPRKVVTAGPRKVATGGAQKRPAGGGASRSSSRRREQEEEYEEKSKAPMIIVGVLVLGAAGFGVWSLMGGDPETPGKNGEVVDVPAETTDSAANASANTTTPAAANSTSAEVASSSTPDPAEGDVTDTAAEAAPEAAKSAPVAKASEEFTLPAAGERINTRGVSDASRILLDQVTPLERAADTSEDIWKEAVEDLALYLEDSGASSNRAGNRLAEDYPRAAYPAIVNAMMKVDYTTADGLYLASSLNNLIIRIGTKDMNWKAVEFDEAGSDQWNTKVAFNKKVVAAWHNLWIDTYASSISSWNAFSNVKAEGGAVEEADTGGIVGPDDDLFD